MTRFRSDGHAGTAPLAFIIAGAIFLASASAVLVTTTDAGSGGPQQRSADSIRAEEARTLLDIMLSPGITSDGVAWADNAGTDIGDGLPGSPDSLDRLGLRNTDNESLSFDKLKNLRHALRVAADDGYANYDEVRASMGLADEGLGFHLRIKPALKSVEDLLAAGERQSDVKVTYLGDFDGDYTDGARQEIAMLDLLIDDFCPFAFDNMLESLSRLTLTVEYLDRCTAPQPDDHVGSVMPAHGNTLKQNIEDRLMVDGAPDYGNVTHLIIGSGFKHSELSANEIKDTIEDWVAGGGTVIMFEGGGNSYTWMNSGYKLKMQDDDDPVQAADPGHALLTTPNTLDWAGFRNGAGWTQGNGGGAVILDDAVTTSGATVLGVNDRSVSSSAGDGTVIVTSWNAGDMYGDGSTDLMIGAQLVQNLLVFGYHDLYIDYGEDIPIDQAVVPASATVEVYHPDLEDWVSLTVTLYLFASPP